MTQYEDPVPEDPVAAREYFARFLRLLPIGSAAVIVTYGMFVLVCLSSLVLGREASLPILKASLVFFAVAGFFQTALYALRRDTSHLCLIATCATMLMAQVVSVVYVPPTVGLLLLSTGLWAVLMAMSLFFAFKAMSISKRNAAAADRKLRETLRKIRL